MTELSFAHLRSTRPRTEKLRGIVLHWTGGIRPPDGVYDTLRDEVGPHTPDGLSVHYVVGVDGTVEQYAPASLVCLHAGKVNPWTIGIEIVSPGVVTPNNEGIRKKERARGVNRTTYLDRVRGTRVYELLDYTLPQTMAVVQLVEELCDRHNIPRRVPTDRFGYTLRREMSNLELAEFSGVLGHYHCHPKKLDPGPRILDQLADRWDREAVIVSSLGDQSLPLEHMQAELR